MFHLACQVTVNSKLARIKLGLLKHFTEKKTQNKTCSTNSTQTVSLTNEYRVMWLWHHTLKTFHLSFSAKWHSNDFTRWMWTSCCVAYSGAVNVRRLKMCVCNNPSDKNPEPSSRWIYDSSCFCWTADVAHSLSYRTENTPEAQSSTSLLLPFIKD